MLGNPDIEQTSVTFGQIRASNANYTPRSLQLGVRFEISDIDGLSTPNQAESVQTPDFRPAFPPQGERPSLFPGDLADPAVFPSEPPVACVARRNGAQPARARPPLARRSEPFLASTVALRAISDGRCSGNTFPLVSFERFGFGQQSR